MLLGLLLGLAALPGVALRVHLGRRAALRGFAAEHGWRPARLRAPRELPLGRGARRTGAGLAGSWGGRPARAYQVTVSRATGGQPEVRTWSVLEVDLPAALPDLDLVPLDAFTRAVARLAPPGLELESDDLARRYRITTTDAFVAAAVLGPRTVGALLDAVPVRVRVRGDRLVCWAPGRLEPAGLTDRLAAVGAVLDGVPAFVWSDARLERSA